MTEKQRDVNHQPQLTPEERAANKLEGAKRLFAEIEAKYQQRSHHNPDPLLPRLVSEIHPTDRNAFYDNLWNFVFDSVKWAYRKDENKRRQVEEYLCAEFMWKGEPGLVEGIEIRDTTPKMQLEVIRTTRLLVPIDNIVTYRLANAQRWDQQIQRYSGYTQPYNK